MAYCTGGFEHSYFKTHSDMRHCQTAGVKHRTVTLFRAIGLCGGSPDLLRRAVQEGEMQEVVDPQDPTKRLYRYREYEDSDMAQVTHCTQSGAKGSAAQGPVTGFDLAVTWQDAGTAAGSAAGHGVPLPGNASASTGAKLALMDGSELQKSQTLVDNACNKGSTVIYAGEKAIAVLPADEPLTACIREPFASALAAANRHMDELKALGIKLQSGMCMVTAAAVQGKVDDLQQALKTVQSFTAACPKARPSAK